MFVTFKTMSGKSRCLSLFADAHLNSHEDASENQKQFLDHWLKIEKALPPSSYNWPNYAYSKTNRCIRKLIFWLIAVIIIVLGFVLILYCQE